MAPLGPRNTIMTTDALGLPSTSREPANIANPPKGGDVDGFRYTLPESLLTAAAGRRYGLVPADLSFVLIEPTQAIEKAVAKFASGDQARFGQRLMDSCLYMIGGSHVNLNQQRLDSWYKAIGNSGRQIVSTIFMEAFLTISPDVIEAVKTSGEAVTC